MHSSPNSGNKRRGSFRTFTMLVLGIAVLGGLAAYYWIVVSTAPTGEKRPGTPDTSGIALKPGGENEASRGPAWFRDATGDSGISFVALNGEDANQFTILESIGSGVALLDYDGDGLLDIFLIGGGFFDGPDKQTIRGAPSKLFRNLGNFRFQDVTKEAGLNISWWYTHGAAVADYDRDGWPDLLVTGFGRIGLFHNESDARGGRKFVDVTEKVGLQDANWSTGAGWADFDGDGYPEFYVCHYTDWSFQNHPICVGQVPGVTRDICTPHRFNPQPHSIFKNINGQKFVEASEAFGAKVSGYGLGVVTLDLNDDGRPDAYVANDMSRNFLFWNRGGKLEERGLGAGASLDDSGTATASMGVDAGDFEGTSRPSLFVTNFQRELHSLYRNLGKESFFHHSRPAGLGALTRAYVGWGTAFVDADCDGWEDLVVVNGHLFRHPAGSPVKQPTLLLRNVEERGKRTFLDVSARAGPPFQTPSVGRGLAVGDLDNDGWPDLIVTHINSPMTILRNDGVRTNPNTTWLGIRLLGKGSRDVVGSTIAVESQPTPLTRFTKGGGSYLSASDSRVLFGLGNTKNSRRVTVKWSWGQTESWDNLDPGHYYELSEGQPVAKQVADSNR